jgi:uncharacterized repeat protein (TIGR01451 family)
MVADNFRRNIVSTVIVLAIVLSMAIFALPSASAGGVTSTPGGTTIENVVSGQTFLLRHELYFDQAGSGGVFTIGINWVAPSSDENFTLENVPSVYWISGPENGLPVENVEWDNYPTLDGWSVGAFIDASNKNYIDGHFNVDIWLRARSGNGTLHREDNQQLSYGPGIYILEGGGPSIIPIDNVIVNVIKPQFGVNVSILPGDQGNFPGRTLLYMVTITNVGKVLDSYALENSDNAGWVLALSSSLVGPLSPGASDNVILTVAIPGSATYGTVDNITVTARSQGDNTKSDNDSCLGRAASPGVDVLISPDNQGNFPGRTISYTVTVTNVGGGVDNFILENSDSAGWVLSLSDNRVGPLSPGASDNVILTVTIPGIATYGILDNITVTATSRENENISDNNSCIGYAASPGVDVLISPPSQENLPGRTLSYTVTVTNIGGGVDNFTLENSDSAGWVLALDNNFVGPLSPGASDNVILTVTIPGIATYGILDNITVTATSAENGNVSNNASCLGQVAGPSFEVSISPPSQENLPGGKLSYTIEISNTGIFDDNYKLTFVDNIDGSNYWEDNISLDNNLVLVQAGGIVTTMLRVTIPDNSPLVTDDNIVVIATSQFDNTIENSASCIAHVSNFVSVSISPTSENGFRGDNLTYEVTIKNIGTSSDNFKLMIGDNAGSYPSWGPKLDNENFYNVLPGEENHTTLRVTVSWYSPPGTSDNIVVRVASMENENIYAEDSCIAQSSLPLEETIYPTDDSYVNASSPATNYASSTDLDLGTVAGAGNGPERVFLKFSLGLPGGSIIDSAFLHLTGTKTSAVPVVLCIGADDNWNENIITWNTQPAIGVTIDNKPGGTQSWTVTDFAKAKFENENDQTVSFCLKSLNEGDPSYVVYSSKENKINTPYLQVTYHVINTHSVVVAVLPSFAVGMRSISSSVMVKNVGWENSSYTLENVGTLGWSLTLDNNQFNNIPPGESRTTTLHITIPHGSTPQTRDDITIRAISIENESTIGSDNCIAYSALPLVSISPSMLSGSHGVVENYTVTITNPETVPDNFVLTVSDNSSPSWAKTLDNNRFDNVQIGGSISTTLRVLLDWRYPPGSSDNVTVSAALAADENVTNNDSCIAYQTPVDVMNIYPIDDSYVLENTPDNNFGARENLLVGVSDGTVWPGGKARSFLKFYIAIPGGSTIDNAFENLFPLHVLSGTPWVQSYSVNADNWDERTITWNTQPARGVVLDNRQISSTLQGWTAWTVTDFIKQQYENAEDRFASISMVESSENDNWAGFVSKDVKEATFKPYLPIFYQLSSRSVLVTILPSDKKVGDTLSYPVTVQNVGWENSSYTLENVGTLGWSLSLDNNRFDNIQPGGVMNTRLYVTLPRDASTLARDEITVSATCIENENTVGSAVRVTDLIRSVTVSTPSIESSARPHDNIIYTVTVTNTGNITDNYSLVVSDSENWGPTLSATSLTIVGLESDNVTLTVQIPVSPSGTRDNIQVRVTSQTDNSVFDMSLCSVRTASWFDRLEVSITPDYLENLIGENLTFIVTITNTGSIIDNFLLTAVDNAGWGPTLSDSWVWLENGTSENVLLQVTIPENAENFAFDKITVTAASAENENIAASASCTAHALVSPPPPIAEYGVQVSISPESLTGKPKDELKFTVTVKNIGEAEDSYDLTVSDVPGWKIQLDDNMLTILENENTTVTVSVTVPSDAVEGDSTTITVTATSRGDPTKSDIATCTATASAGGGAGGGVSPWVYVGVVVVIAVVIAVVLILIIR